MVEKSAALTPEVAVERLLDLIDVSRVELGNRELDHVVTSARGSTSWILASVAERIERMRTWPTVEAGRSSGG